MPLSFVSVLHHKEAFFMLKKPQIKGLVQFNNDLTVDQKTDLLIEEHQLLEGGE